MFEKNALYKWFDSIKNFVGNDKLGISSHIVTIIHLNVEDLKYSIIVNPYYNPVKLIIDDIDYYIPPKSSKAKCVTIVEDHIRPSKILNVGCLVNKSFDLYTSLDYMYKEVDLIYSEQNIFIGEYKSDRPDYLYMMDIPLYNEEFVNVTIHETKSTFSFIDRAGEIFSTKSVLRSTVIGRKIYFSSNPDLVKRIMMDISKISKTLSDYDAMKKRNEMIDGIKKKLPNIGDEQLFELFTKLEGV